MKSESDFPRTISRLPVRTTSVQSHATIKRGRLPKGSLLPRPAIIPSVKGPLTRLYWSRFPGLVRGREQSAIVRAIKPRSGSASLAPTSWST